MKKRVSIKEASRLSGLTVTTIYRYVNNMKLTCYNMKKHGKTVKEIDMEQLSELLGKDLLKPDNNMEKHDNNSYSHVNTLTIENLNEAIQQAIEQQQKVLTKPLEEQALYICGALTKENEFLKQQIETLRQELEAVKLLPVDITEKEKEILILQEQLKILPELKDEIQQFKAASVVGNDTIRQLTEEKAILKEQLSILPVAPEKIPELLKLEAERFASMEDKCIREVQEKEDLRKTLQEEQEAKQKRTQEKEYLEAELKKLQQEADGMRQKLSRPWWKIW